jgi:pilus assembly protein FimV
MDVADTERRINQVRNDVYAIYDQLTTVQMTQNTHGRQLTSLSNTVSHIWTSQQEHGERLNHLDSALAVLTEKVGGFEGRFGQIDERFGQIDQRFGQIDERLARMDERFDEHDAKLDEHGRKLDEQGRKLDLIIEALNIRPN